MVFYSLFEGIESHQELTKLKYANLFKKGLLPPTAKKSPKKRETQNSPPPAEIKPAIPSEHYANFDRYYMVCCQIMKEFPLQKAIIAYQEFIINVSFLKKNDKFKEDDVCALIADKLVKNLDDVKFTLD